MSVTISPDAESFAKQADILRNESNISLFERELNQKEIDALLQRYFYLQIVNGKIDYNKMTAGEIITADSDWKIHDFGQAMSTSPGYLMLDDNSLPIDDDGSFILTNNSDSENTPNTISRGKGTLSAQAYSTAQQMISIASQKGWEGVVIAYGDPFMTRAAWMGCETYGLPYGGFTPNDQNWEHYDRIDIPEAELYALRTKIRERRKTSSFSGG